VYVSDFQCDCECRCEFVYASEYVETLFVCRSEAFDTMFSSDMVEGRTGKVKVPECSRGIFFAFLEFVYVLVCTRVLWMLVYVCVCACVCNCVRFCPRFLFDTRACLQFKMRAFFSA
jgi:hypothetical protein